MISHDMKKNTCHSFSCLFNTYLVQFFYFQICVVRVLLHVVYSFVFKSIFVIVLFYIFYEANSMDSLGGRRVLTKSRCDLIRVEAQPIRAPVRAFALARVNNSYLNSCVHF